MINCPLNFVANSTILWQIDESGHKNLWQAVGVIAPLGYFYYTATWTERRGGGSSARTVSPLTRFAERRAGQIVDRDAEAALVAKIEALEEGMRAMGWASDTEPDAAVDTFIPAPPSYPLPMRAGKYAGRFAFPCLCQPRIDGVRCLTDGERFWNAKGEPFSDVVVAQFRFDTNGMILDGKLTLPELDYSMADIRAACSGDTRINAHLTKHLEFLVSDAVPDGKQIAAKTDFLDRYGMIKEMLKQAESVGILPERISLVKAAKVTDKKHARERLARALDLGYTAIVLRSADGLYVVGERSGDALVYEEGTE